MTPLQTAEVRAGAIRIRLAEIGGMAELTDETPRRTGHPAERVWRRGAPHGRPADFRT